MQRVDQVAYGNRLTAINPAAKAGLTLLVILLCLTLNRPLVGVTAVGWMLLLMLWAGIPARTFARLLTAEAAFLALTTVGIALSISVAVPEEAWRSPIGPFWLSTSPDNLYRAALAMMRALGATAALNFLAFTTPLTDIVVLLQRCRVPDEIIDIMVLMVRFIFVLIETLQRMRIAQESRLGYQTGYWRQMHNAALIGARLFVNATERSRRLEVALQARGYESVLRVLTPNYQPFPKYGWVVMAISLSLWMVWLGDKWLL